MNLLSAKNLEYRASDHRKNRSRHQIGQYNLCVAAYIQVGVRPNGGQRGGADIWQVRAYIFVSMVVI